MRKAIARILRGFRGVQFGCATGTAGQLLAQAERVRPQLILIDVGLVALDSFSALRRLRAASGARIVLLTIHDGEELRAIASKNVADACICKSRLSQEIHQEIARLFPAVAGIVPVRARLDCA